MPGDIAVADWIVNKIGDDPNITANSIGAGFLKVFRKGGEPFTAVAIGIKGVITLQDVVPLFRANESLPQFVVNVPSKTIWQGEAIEFIHDAPAAFGTMGDLLRASRDTPASSYRNKQYSFFEQAFRQHSAVEGITRLYDRVFQLHRRHGLADCTVALVDAYDMSAEDIRHTRDLYGPFDVAVKMSSYGSITTAATDAAKSMGAEALNFRMLMGRLNK